jgi:hypothetical protein
VFYSTGATAWYWRRTLPTTVNSNHSYLGISQRDPNYYPFLNERDMERQVTDAISRVWEENVKGKWEVTRGNCEPSNPFTKLIQKSHRNFRYV